MKLKNYAKQIFIFLKKISKRNRSPFGQIFSLLIILIFVFTIYSFTEKPIKIGKFEIKQNGIKEFFSPSEPLLAYCLVNPRDFAKVETTPIDSSAQRFLLIGDSMLEGLGLRLNDYCKENGHTMNSVIWYSSSTLWYGNCDTISYFIKKFDPTYIILVIGGNELFIKDILKDREPFAKNILKQVGDRKYIWVGPPNWKKDSGINKLILKNVGRQRYFPSLNLTFDRCKDGAHPTTKSAGAWMDSIASFMMNKCMNPVIMDFPKEKASKRPPTTVLGPHPPEGL
ncbi:MAG TPA: SGNH/GDSL hydrolase family protein [Bacteroidales bacterium]|nr:SGNH/GDSL hydrolase family protein [Bacteroidales bacterium]HPS15685.1 SGNH/GDSL hydrolase family protein [Bacteroidales bacterium]